MTAAPATAPLLAERQGEVLTVTLNRPDKMNALSAPAVEGLLDVVQRAYDDGTRTLVLRGNGKNFSAGFDFTEFEAQSEADLLHRFVRIELLLQAVYHAPFETVALAHGRNFGAGVDLICACARRFGAPGSTFCMPGLRFGLVLGTRRLADRIGEVRARAILLAGRTFEAEEGLRLGFLEAIAEPPEWEAIVESIGAAAGRLSATSLRALCGRTVTDTRAEDMYHLVTSACAPGIKARMQAYREQRR